MHSSKELNRRAVLIGTAAFSFAGLLAACSGGTSSDDVSLSEAESDGPGSEGGTLVGIMTQQIPANLDPITNSAGAALSASGPAHDWLEYIDVDGEFFPSIASEVVQVDASVVRYSLRDRVRFQNGETVDAQAVHDLIRWVKDPSNGAWLGESLSDIEPRVIDDLTLELHSASPNVAVRSLLTQLPIVPVSTMDSQGTEPIGCGPYKFVRWTQGSSIEYEKDPEYRNADQITVHSIIMEHFSDANAGTQAFIAGKQNWVYPSSLAQAPDLQARASRGEFNYVEGEPGWAYIALNNQTEPFSDPRVRKAVRLAIDRDQIIASAFNGVGRPFYTMFPPESGYYTSDLEYDRDLQEARQLLADAGYGEGFSTKIYTPNVDYFQGIATIARENLSEIGINLTVEVEETPAIIDRGLARKDFEMLVLAAALAPEPERTVDRFFRSTGSSNLMQYNNDEVDEMLNEALKLIDEEARTQLYQRIQTKALIEDSCLVPVSSEALPAAYRNCNYEEFIGLYIQYINWHEARLD